MLLNNGVVMPSIGFGTAALGGTTQAAVQEALAAGYRHLDGAQVRMSIVRLLWDCYTTDSTRVLMYRLGSGIVRT